MLVIMVPVHKSALSKIHDYDSLLIDTLNVPLVIITFYVLSGLFAGGCNDSSR